ncbi:MAG: L-asparaginase [Candidatus Edwardsbacteria bacterium RIFOXYD12_FULL_50_11]|uniref:L-asparaginase n=1 Tax=Candidatus Edwardsbacteria bacterium GWF2_54_11 TaxID=1817851 RepID=A0A1F5REV8_9BACT|nr:MAG: L-asparaginase [Candidatus Edwardsbacteria bacterium RifOxyC12_full_54_24]OGF09031.1 MAG: L-asparaginase [Candidatus Edwardsbacteria bacterium RifOxyA12_full_54_48]OGF12443.1 MAG: L-asparaginase [Candidatus Edwardsbacteria bacterium GWE2_54_12]OGF12918.1 MAG: L-asparaginase [Candidatus Edwardsbacteria bacterium GWF2_54_11]OGF17452.1 MAG: L-asparaginase [Candidatus Edwardsbacteria bacterium RIFOXYD12_FULL_50_11]OGJ17732.1 MAG: L-asparaginase [Candidatus Edwardsbacteria bacterium RifOxyB
MTKPKIAIIFTGGTISMKSSKKSGGAVPAFKGRDILKLLPVINKNFKIEVHDFGQYPGPHITPEMMLEISLIARKYLARSDIMGLIVTHGTDTLEETAYFLDLTIHSPKPVVVVGAMKDCTELGWDGPANLMGAARTAVSPDARNKGVLVFLNNTINSAGEVTKTSTDSFETFRSPDLGPLGWVDQDRVLFYRQPMYREHYPVRGIEPRVDLFKMAVGMDSRLIEYAVDSGAKGLVVEGMGRGNIPPDVVPGIEYAIAKKIPVVLCSRCIGGRVLGTYAYPGGGAQLIKKGIILGGHLPGQKARIKLMILLGRRMDPMQIKEFFERFEYPCER